MTISSILLVIAAVIGYLYLRHRFVHRNDSETPLKPREYSEYSQRKN